MRFGLFLAVVAAIDVNAPDPKAVGVRCSSTEGNFTLVVNPSWAPLGAARFLSMVDSGFFDRIAAFRVVPGFLVQFGIPFTNNRTWPPIQDDPNVGVQCPVFKRGMIAFAGYAPNTRTTQVFIGFQDDPNLGRDAWDNPFGMVTTGMEVVDKFYSGYGDLTAFGGHAPDPTRIQNQGGAFLLRDFPNLDYITSCARLPRAPAMPTPKGGAGSRPPSPSVPCTAPTAAPPTIPQCSPEYCGAGIGFTGTAVCLCHENCLFPDSALPCCVAFNQVCPNLYAHGVAAVAAQSAQAQSGQSTQSGQSQSGQQSDQSSQLSIAPTPVGKGKQVKKVGKKVVG